MPPSTSGTHPISIGESYGWDATLLDAGCELWDRCLTCPVPQCREDVGLRAARATAQQAGVAVLSRPRPPQQTAPTDEIRWERQLRYLYDQGVTAAEATEDYGFSPSHVRRAYDSFPGESPSYYFTEGEKVQALGLLAAGAEHQDVAFLFRKTRQAVIHLARREGATSAA